MSGFVEDAARHNVEFRFSRKAFIERGLASGKAARKSGGYVALFEIENRGTVSFLAVRQQREEDCH